MMTGGAQARLRPSLIPHFTKEIYKMKNGMKEKREEHVKNVKRLVGEAEKSYLCHRRQASISTLCSLIGNKVGL